MIQKTMMGEVPLQQPSSQLHPFRPPKSPSSSSHVVTNKNLYNVNVVTPKSPRTTTTTTRSSPILSKQQTTTTIVSGGGEASQSDAVLSPTSVAVAVVDPRGFLFPSSSSSERRKKKGKNKSRRSSRSRHQSSTTKNGGGGGTKQTTALPNESDRSLIQAGNQCMKEGNVVGANFAFELLVKERRTFYGNNHRLVGLALNELAMIHLEMGNYGQAEKEFAQAAAIHIRSSTKRNNSNSSGGRSAAVSHPLDVVKCLVNLGKSRLLQEKVDGAHSVFRDAIKIVRTKLGYDDVHVAAVQSQIGCLLFDVGDLTGALRAFADALSVHRANDNKVALAQTLCDIGSIHLEQKSLDPAIECFLEALQLQRETFGDFHRDVIVTLDNLAFVHTKKRDYDKALKYYNETLQAQVAFYGEFTNECKETKRKEQLVLKKYCRSRCARERAMTA